MHVYNAILVLKEILEVFPIAAVNEVVGSSIDFEISKLINSEERGDLKILARACVYLLKFGAMVLNTCFFWDLVTLLVSRNAKNFGFHRRQRSASCTNYYYHPNLRVGFRPSKDSTIKYNSSCTWCGPTCGSNL